MVVETLPGKYTDFDTISRFIGDTEEELIEKEIEYKIDYHPSGYGTKRNKLEQTDNGKWLLEMWRMNSCD